MKRAAAAPAAAAPAAVASGVAGVEATADATDEVSDLAESMTLPVEPEKPRRKIPANPSAGEVHRREAGSAWRVEAEQQIRQGNDKAREEQAEKRRWGLAKQVQDGLIHNFGINYGVAELAALLKQAIVVKSQGKTELTSTEVAYVQLLVAAEKYDLKQLVVLIDKFPKGRNAAAAQKNKS